MQDVYYYITLGNRQKVETPGLLYRDWLQNFQFELFLEDHLDRFVRSGWVQAAQPRTARVRVYGFSQSVWSL